MITTATAVPVASASKSSSNRSSATVSVIMTSLNPDAMPAFNAAARRQASPPRRVEIPVSLGQLKDAFPYIVKDIIIGRFMGRPCTVTTWIRADPDGDVYGWPDQIKIDLMEDDVESVLIYPAIVLTRVDISILSAVLGFYQLHAGVANSTRALIVTMLAEEGVLTLAEQNGFEVVLVQNPTVVEEALARSLEDHSRASLPPAPPPSTLAPPPPTAAVSTSTPASASAWGSWLEFFVACGIPLDQAELYEPAFVDAAIELEQIPDLNLELLKELRVKFGHLMKIMKVVQQMHPPAVN